MSSTSAKKANNSENGRWKKSEHDKFMKALEKYGRDWVKVQKMVKTRSLAQVRSHAQKTFLKMSDADVQALIAPSDYDCSEDEKEKYLPVKRKEKFFEENQKESSVELGKVVNDKKIQESSDIPDQDSFSVKKQIDDELEGKSSSKMPLGAPSSQEQQFVSGKNSSLFMQLFSNNVESFFLAGNFINLFSSLIESQ